MTIIPLNAHKRTWLAIRRRIVSGSRADKVLFSVLWCSMEGVVDMVKSMRGCVGDVDCRQSVTSAPEEKIVFNQPT